MGFRSRTGTKSLKNGSLLEEVASTWICRSLFCLKYHLSSSFERKLPKLALRLPIIFSEAFVRRQAGVTVASTILIALGVVAAAGQDARDDEGIHKIRHVVIIMQENRSFDHYFGTFPGRRGHTHAQWRAHALPVRPRFKELRSALPGS